MQASLGKARTLALENGKERERADEGGKMEAFNNNRRRKEGEKKITERGGMEEGLERKGGNVGGKEGKKRRREGRGKVGSSHRCTKCRSKFLISTSLPPSISVPTMSNSRLIDRPTVIVQKNKIDELINDPQ